MKIFFLTLLALATVGFSWSQSESKPKRYELSADSKPKDGVAKGRVVPFLWETSKVFPGTRRHGAVYIPQQHDGSEPAALMVFQDGHTVFLNPGHLDVEGSIPNGWKPKPKNRSFEYDSLGGAYARFLLEEILPFIEAEHGLKISKDPEKRAICGISSGGICAFTVAWERPDSFRKVLSHVGSFTNIRGGHVYPAMIRKTEPKPLRVYLQDGEHDLDNEHGNWPLANQQMAKALAFQDYDYQLIWGEGGHSGNHGGAVLPDALRWLWR